LGAGLHQVPHELQRDVLRPQAARDDVAARPPPEVALPPQRRAVAAAAAAAKQRPGGGTVHVLGRRRRRSRGAAQALHCFSRRAGSKLCASQVAAAAPRLPGWLPNRFFSGMRDACPVRSVGRGVLCARKKEGADEPRGVFP
jgi:hypothetical protein